ncbi:MAG: hypothetical protein QNK33_05295 [Bacteroidales bacterium]|nr:hypothetical protein [Bacteroidales bacterium]
MSKLYSLSYFEKGNTGNRIKDYPSFLDAKSDIPCAFEFKSDGVHKNKERFEILATEIDPQNKKTRILKKYIYIKNE